MGLKLFYRDVTYLDFAYWSAELGPVGNSLRVHVELAGKTDEDGIISDFSKTKKQIKSIIDEHVDHRFLAPRSIIKEAGGYVVVESQTQSQDYLYYKAPCEAVCVLDSHDVTNLVIKEYMEKAVLEHLPENITTVNIHLEENSSPGDKHCFQYTHGLKHHYGNCQRLLHGHNNPVRVWVNNQRNTAMEKYLAKDLFGHSIHFAFKDNIVNFDEVENLDISYGPLAAINQIHLKYQSGQGEFEMKLPGKLVNLVPLETSVENLSIYFYRLVKDKCDQNDQVKIQAFEGIGKGAIYTS